MNAINIPEILLPKKADMTRWSVNACDQFTSDYAYWEELDKFVGDSVSTLRLIFPEIYLKDNPEARIEKINATMRSYLDNGIFESVDGGFILVERTTQSGTRTGLMLAIDLEDYDFTKDSKALIRSTEATILERIPPRVQIRKNAPVELPHIMLLYDDKEGKVLSSVKRGKVLYDFEMNMGGGHVKGTFVENAEQVRDALYALASADRYGNGESLLFAVGDGNHSLATAKTCWDNLKSKLSEEERKVHPARFALVEAVNVHDHALTFEPIHRLIKTDKADKFVAGLHFTGEGEAKVFVGGTESKINFPKDVPQGIRQLDEYVTRFLAENGGEVDYIHGEEEIKKFSDLGVGVMLPAIGKDDFFRLIVTGGNLPRKTFSMGEGNEKRYYIEAKRL